jgi:trimethylamine-N-oxide reductase (cytochrome c)
MVDAYRSPKIEFFMAQHPWLENDCLFADIVLPANTKLEEEDLGHDNITGQFTTLFHEEKAIDPIGESKSDYEIVCAVAERLGLLKEYTQGKSIEEWIRVGFETSGAQGYMSFEQWMDKGYLVVPTEKNWQDNYVVGWRGFYENPEKYPLKTPTGKMEFYSQKLADTFPDDDERPPYPKWIDWGESHTESLRHPRAKKYPLLTQSNHPRWGVHAQHEDITWIREISTTCKIEGPDGYLYHPAWLHPSEAAKRGIKNGDIIKIFNERGAVLAGTYVTERIMPGVVYVDHGAKYDPIVPGVLDRGGAINAISPHNTTSKNAAGMVVSGFLSEVERVDLEELARQYPEAFSRPFHPAAGPSLESYLYGVGIK